MNDVGVLYKLTGAWDGEVYISRLHVMKRNFREKKKYGMFMGKC